MTCPAENRILRINPVTNLVEKRIEVSAGPRALASGGGSVWVLCDKDGKIDRIDPKTNKVTKTIDLMTPGAGGNLAFGEGFLWVTQTGFPLTRIDPKSDEEKVVQQFWGEGGGFISVSSGAVWLSNTAHGYRYALRPEANLLNARGIGTIFMKTLRQNILCRRCHRRNSLACIRAGAPEHGASRRLREEEGRWQASEPARRLNAWSTARDDFDHSARRVPGGRNS